jgi:hypothetical protein
MLFHRAASLLPEKPDDDVPLNPLAISLQPDRWEADGLFAEDGISLTRARELLPGIDEMFLEERGAVATAGGT